MDPNDINKFWLWFSENEIKLRPKNITNEFINKLDSKILALGNFSWEIRKGLNKENLLVISPNGSIELLAKTKVIIDEAPTFDSWEFTYYKPAKDWDFKLSTQESNGTTMMLDVSSWEYVLLKFPDNTYDMILKGDNIKQKPEEEKNVIIDIVLESILGEKLSLQLIKNIEFVNDFDGEYKTKKTSIKYLKDHLYDKENVN